MREDCESMEIPAMPGDGGSNDKGMAVQGNRRVDEGFDGVGTVVHR